MFKIHSYFIGFGSGMERFDIWHHSVENISRMMGERASLGLKPFKTRQDAETWALRQGISLAQ
jgi:hypothetical protein